VILRASTCDHWSDFAAVRAARRSENV